MARRRQSAATGARTGKHTRSVHANEEELEDWYKDGRPTASNRGGNGGQAAAVGGEVGVAMAGRRGFRAAVGGGEGTAGIILFLIKFEGGTRCTPTQTQHIKL